MLNLDIARQRLHSQRITGMPVEQPEDVVMGLGAVQAQDYLGAKWALALRMQNATDNAIEQAFTNGTILRTHVMRPTWHFVTPDDIRWLLMLTAPRVNTKLVTMDRRLELDRVLLLRSYKVIADALSSCKQLTRSELGFALAQAGIVAEGLRLTHIVMHAELDAVVCSGGRRGKQFTYALLDERAPQARVLKRDEALAELTMRYFTGHGPATTRDFAWWSGLTVADAKAGPKMVEAGLDHETIDDQTYWFSAAMPPVERSPAAILLPTFDEFLVGFASFDQSRRGGPDSTRNLVFDSTIVIGGGVVGTWRRTFKNEAVVIEIAPFVPLTAAEHEAVRAAAARYGQFVGMRVEFRM